jgi:hypothetical protein
MENSLDKAIDKYIEKGFGSMNKNDFEVFIIHALQQREPYNKMSNNDLSRTLRIPETKIKRLRYEATLKYQLDENILKNNIYTALEHAHVVRGSERCIELCIEDEATQKYINSELKKDFRHSDSSFNSEILKLTVDDYIYLLRVVYGSDTVSKEEKRIIKNGKKVENEENGVMSLKKIIGDFITNLLTDQGSTMINMAISFLQNLSI